MNQQNGDNLSSIEELCERMERLLTAKHLSEEEKREFAHRALQVIRGDGQREVVKWIS